MIKRKELGFDMGTDGYNEVNVNGGAIAHGKNGVWI
jgi:hypothetical protein